MLVVAQVALSLVVLVCGGLFIKSFRKAQTMDPGFDNPNGLIVFLSPTLIGYEEEQSRELLSSRWSSACRMCRELKLPRSRERCRSATAPIPMVQFSKRARRCRVALPGETS